MTQETITISKINDGPFKNFSLSFPLTSVVCLTGCSGIGKSTLLDVTYRALFKGKDSWKIRLKSVNVKGKTNVRRSYIVPQLPISDHPSSILATYTKVWGNIREIFSNEKLTKKLGRLLEKNNMGYFEGTTWTIDAPYRETKKEVEKYSKQGISTVEMEASALFAVAKYRKIKITLSVILTMFSEALILIVKQNLEAPNRKRNVSTSND